MAQVIRELAAANGWADRVVVVNKVLQNIGDVEVPEQVDVIVHETLGNFLFAERGIETVLLARQRFLRPGGKLFPAFATLCLAPFEDAHIYQARRIKASNLWADTDFFGVDLSSQEGRARSELFARPLSDQFHPDQLRADASTQAFDFRTLLPEELQDFSVGLACRAKSTCVVHGVAGWFEAHFEGSACSVILSTSPWDCCTHWWQTRLMLEQPLAVNEGQAVSGSVAFAACEGNTYRCRLVLESGGVRREQAGMELIDTDGTHRSVKNKTVQLQSGAQVLTRPITGGQHSFREELDERQLAAAYAAAHAAALRHSAGDAGGAAAG
ncbi:unnamed protein product [Prorocentrum cordatum]|uniref:type I protein arginine methyltransferase n=1 Tax=Prorocentrum cordatum TaxID=2364126 RepID=A0ABN9TDU8_9DINO|nr:unnamed protein product [Polarella glacialis]